MLMPYDVTYILKWDKAYYWLYKANGFESFYACHKNYHINSPINYL